MSVELATYIKDVKAVDPELTDDECLSVVEEIRKNLGSLDLIESAIIESTINLLEFYHSCPHCGDQIEHRQMDKHIHIHHFDEPDYNEEEDIELCYIDNQFNKHATAENINALKDLMLRP